ncbi:MAG: cytochrome P450 [Alphaproteobacteria bacterium]|nr:cytochrome P450 [Alphaproteobacteria bacterium]
MPNSKTPADPPTKTTGSPAASSPAATAPPLYPPAIDPPDQPLPLLAFLREFPKNPLRSVPISAYEDDITVLRSNVPKTTYAWVTSPALIEELLIRHSGDLIKSRVEKRVFARTVGNSVLTADGDKWRWQRRALAPLFRHSEIIGYVDKMSRAADDQVAEWRTAGPGIRNVETDMTDVTLQVIMRTMLASTDRDISRRIMTATEAYLSKSSWEAAYAILQLPRWFPHPGTWRMVASARSLREIMAELIDNRRSPGVKPAGIGEDRDDGHDDDLLGRLLNARDPETGQPMDEEGLIDNLSTLLLAGHETTAKALTWTLYLLARAPVWQEAVRQEVIEVAGDAPITGEHIDRLQITTRVLKESMRLYPPVPVVARVNTAFIRAGGENLPTGANIVFPVFAIHRHKKIWDDPNRFDPDRFLPAKEKAIPRTGYMPFGAGPRICIGQSFAMMEATALLATFIRAARFGWDGQHKPEPLSRITLKPAGGMPLEVEPL